MTREEIERLHQFASKMRRDLYRQARLIESLPNKGELERASANALHRAADEIGVCVYQCEKAKQNL